jgi:hypothetical protein
MEIDSLRKIHTMLIKVVTLIEQKYGRNKITPNLHLSLHLCECSLDFGPLYAFWCFSFERMNGMLGELNRTPNISHITHKVVRTLNQKYILWHNSVNIEARKMKLLPLESS